MVSYRMPFVALPCLRCVGEMPKTCSQGHGLSPPQSMLRFTLAWYLSTALISAGSFSCAHIFHKFAGFGWHKHAQKS